MGAHPRLELFFERFPASGSINTIYLAAIGVFAEAVIDMLGESSRGLGVGFMDRRAADLFVPQIAKHMHHLVIRHLNFSLSSL
jgi:hypothetical protein